MNDRAPGQAVDAIQPVILCGGAGTRLWPLSREQHPKQLLSLLGEHSLLQATVLRLDGYPGGHPLRAPIVVGNEEYRFVTAEQFRRIGREPAALILEPAGRNTAPALALAALRALAQGDDPVLLAMPADHAVKDGAAFRAAVARGMALAAAGAVVAFGVVPTRAETGYGYLRTGAALEGGLRLDAFVEKPDAETAARYLAEGAYLWNSGMFMLRAGLWLELLGRHAPEMLAACRRAFQAGREDGPFLRVGRQDFLACGGDSIDYAVMEPLAADPAPLAPVAVVPLVAGWSDVGAWDALLEAAERDGDGNSVSGDVMLEDVRNSLVLAGERLVACIGLDGAVVVETPDAVLVATKERAQEVKAIVARLKAERRTEAVAHRKTYRPWGHYVGIAADERFQVKRIVVNPGASLSLQMHHHRAEHWVVVRGTAQVECGEETLLLTENQSTYIPLGCKHRLSNPGLVPLEIIEVQSGGYLGEDDIVRFADRYGR